MGVQIPSRAGLQFAQRELRLCFPRGALWALTCPAVNSGPRPGVGALWWPQRRQPVPSSTRSGGDPPCCHRAPRHQQAGSIHPGVWLPSSCPRFSGLWVQGEATVFSGHLAGTGEGGLSAHWPQWVSWRPHPKTSFLLLLCRDWVPRDGAHGLLGSRVRAECTAAQHNFFLIFL